MAPLKPLVWICNEVSSPPLSVRGLEKVATLLRRLQMGELLDRPDAHPMQNSIGKDCYELIFRDSNSSWRIIYRIDPDLILLLDMFQKTTQKTPKVVIKRCRGRLLTFDESPGSARRTR